MAALLLHFNGADGGTTFTDDSVAANTVSHTGLVTTSTDITPVFGSACCVFVGGSVDAKLTVPHSAALVPIGDFCIEVWVWRANASVIRMLLTKGISTGHRPYWLYLSAAQKIVAQCSDTTPSVFVTLTSTTSVALNTWTHVALNRAGDSFTLWLNGVLEASTTASGALYDDGAALIIGNTSNNQFPWGGGPSAYMDELRISNSSVYTVPFTPPTAEFADGGPSGLPSRLRMSNGVF